MSFEIEPGTIVGVVGRSGSGKSTISKLIQRLYIPESGKISIDGMDISLVNPAMLRKQIGRLSRKIRKYPSNSHFIFEGFLRGFSRKI